MKSKREYGFDNVRCILIFLVVFGHFLEPSGTGSRLYLMIYTFHMPVFTFLSGWFGYFRPRRLLKQTGLYLLFQFLYRALECLLSQGSFSMNPLTPCWVLWYLPFLIYCQLLLPLLNRYPRFPALAVSVLLSLAAGFAKFIGYALTLSRFFVFLPYFILGHRLRPHSSSLCRLPGWVLPLFTAAAVVLSLALTGDGISARMLYGTASYYGSYGPALRGLLYLPGTAWCLSFLLLALRNSRHIRLISAIGRSTLWIYLFHGLAVKLIRHFVPLPPYPGSLLPAFLLAAAVTLLFSLPGRIRKP